MKPTKILLLKTLLFYIATALLITFFYPSRAKFKYEYMENRPWRYDLLTAPFDFKIEKSPEQIQQEKDSISRSVPMYYRIDPDVYVQERNKLVRDYQTTLKGEVNSEYINYLMKALEVVYTRGVVSTENYAAIEESPTKSVNVFRQDKVTLVVNVKDLFTVGKAYQYILDNAPRSLSENALRSTNINNYLTTNLTPDLKETEKWIAPAENKVSTIIGTVQSGERIIGKGEVVTPEIHLILESLKHQYESRGSTTMETLLIKFGQFMVTLTLLMFFFFYLYAFRENILSKLKNSLFFLGLFIFIVGLTMLTMTYSAFSIYLIPFAMLPILTCTFFDSRTAYFAHVICVLICAMVAPYQMEFILVEVVAGVVACLTLRNLTDRSNLIKSIFMIFVCSLLTYICYVLSQDGSLKINMQSPIVSLGINMVFLMFTYVLVYVFERLFGYVSNISLVELADINTPLLRQLSEVAPGTFQHSLQVSILATEAASKIGADVQLVRTGALYHDIGKMKNPTYFVENQGGTNPHDRLPYDESAKMIIRHVTDGVEIAERYRLPVQIIDFIRTHHGLSKVKYFYTMYKNENPDEIIDESVFRYPGPNPYSKETGILMMADAVEASSRTLTDLTEKKISNHINRIVDSIVDDGLLKNTPLTFRDVETIKHVFHDKLRTIYHSRIVYPELIKKDPPKSDGDSDMTSEESLSDTTAQ